MIIIEKKKNKKERQYKKQEAKLGVHYRKSAPEINKKNSTKH